MGGPDMDPLLYQLEVMPILVGGTDGWAGGSVSRALVAMGHDCAPSESVGEGIFGALGACLQPQHSRRVRLMRGVGGTKCELAGVLDSPVLHHLECDLGVHDGSFRFVLNSPLSRRCETGDRTIGIEVWRSRSMCSQCCSAPSTSYHVVASTELTPPGAVKKGHFSAVENMEISSLGG
eukprot:1175946-Prorocentrum_minimum.AAC.3